MNNFTEMKIRSLRHKAGVNQEYVAKLMGISVAAYSKIETGVTNVNLLRLRKISEIFNVKITSLLSEDTEDKDQYILKLVDDLTLAKKEIINLQWKLIDFYTNFKT